MNAFTTLLQDEGVVKLGRTLLHFACQGAAAALVAGVLLLTLRRASAAARYVALLCVFAAMALCPVMTFLSLSERALAQPSSPAASLRIERQEFDAALTTAAHSSQTEPAAAPPETRAPVTSRLGSLRDWLEPRLGWLAAAWALGVLVLSLRLAIGWIRLHRTRSAAENLVEGRWQQTLAALSERLRISRPVRLLHSAAQQTPLVMGWLRPVILLPATAMTGLTPAQWEAVLAHELAHLRRHDYLVNLAQTVVEILLFYHPAVWWLSNRIRLEREHCCDDLAVEVCGDATGYARALTELEELRGAPEPAVGAGGPLLTRIRRLVSPPAPRVDLRASWLAAALVLALLLGLGVIGKVTSGDAGTTDPTLDRLIQGMEARGELMRREVRSIRGFYVIRQTEREGSGEMAPAPGEDQGEQAEGPQKFTPRVGVLFPRWEVENDFTGTVLVESVVREHSAWMEGRYRNSRWTVSPDERARREMNGCDRQHYWSYSEKPGNSGPEFVLDEECGEKLVGGAGSWVNWRLGLSGWVDVSRDHGVPRRIWAVRSGNPRLIGEDKANGLTCQVIGYDEPDVTGFERLWVCPALGHAIVRAEGEATGYKNLPAGVYSRHSREYSGFREAFEGLWLPTVVSTKRERQDADGNWVVTGTSEVEVVLLEVNKPVPEEELLPPPQGGTDVLGDEVWEAALGKAGIGHSAGPVAEEELLPPPEGGSLLLTDEQRQWAEWVEAADKAQKGQWAEWVEAADKAEKGQWAEWVEAADKRAEAPGAAAEAPTIRRIQFEGIRELTANDILAVMETKPGDSYDRQRLARDAQAIEQLYQAKGYVVATVLAHRTSGDGILTLTITEGEIEDIAVRGTDEQQAVAVLDSISAKVGDVYNDEAAKRDLAEISSLGWVKSARRDVEVGSAPGKVILVFTVTPRATEISQPAADAEEVVYEVIELKFLDPVYVAWLFGQAELSADAFFLPPASLGIGEAVFEDSTASAGTVVTESPLETFLPEGIEVLAPVAQLSQQLVVGGTPEAVAELREVIAMLDRKPQQVILELTSFRGLPVGADESDFAEGQSEHGGAGRGLFLGVWTDPEPPHDAECRHARVATMNLVPTVNTLMDTLPSGLLFVASPRINSDGTITLYAHIRRAEWEEGKPPNVETAAMVPRVLAQTAVNVKDGEPVGFVFHFEDFWHTVILTPRIVRETHEED